MSCCVFNYGENLLATGSNDKSIHIWLLKGSILNPHNALENAFERRASILSNDSNSSTNCDFICPITQDVMKYPVMCSDGYIYEKAAIQEWITSRRKTSPMTNLPIEDLTLIPQIELQKKIRDSTSNARMNK